MAKPAPLPSAEDLEKLLLLLDCIPAQDEAGHETEKYPLIERDGVLYGRVFRDVEGQAVAEFFAFRSLLNEDLKGFGWLDSRSCVKEIPAAIFVNQKLTMYFMGKSTANNSH